MGGPSEKQWLDLIHIVSLDEEMRTNQFTEGPNGIERLNTKWDDAAEIINKLGQCKKSGKKWKEALSKLKTRSKMAYNDRIAYIKGTGGGVPADLANLGLGTVHTKCLTLMNKVSIVGNVDVPLPLEVNQRQTPFHVDKSRKQPSTGYGGDYRRDFRDDINRGTPYSPFKSPHSQRRSSLGFDRNTMDYPGPSTRWKSPVQCSTAWHSSNARPGPKQWTPPSQCRNYRRETSPKWKKERDSVIDLSDSPLNFMQNNQRELSCKRSPDSNLGLGHPKKKLRFDGEGSPSVNVAGRRAEELSRLPKSGGGGIDPDALIRFNTAIDTLVASVNSLRDAAQHNTDAIRALVSLQESVDLNTSAVAALKDTIVQQLP